MNPSDWLSEAAAQARRGDLVSAMELCDRAVKAGPDYEKAHAARGSVLRCLARHQEALASFDRALEIRPDFAEAHNSRGVVLRDMKRLDEALASHERAIEIEPDYANAWKNRGVVLSDLQRFEEALESHEAVIRLCPQDAQAHNYRGNALHRLRRFEMAVASYDQALALRPDYAEALYNRSLSLRELLRVTEAAASCERALRITPDHADAWWNLAELLILAGDYPRGWPMFEWRWRSERYGKVLRVLDRPLWRGGECLEGKTVLVTVDGGFGDTLNFCRYAPLFEQHGARVIMEVQHGLVALLKASFESMSVIANGQELPLFDCYCPMMSLPGAFALPLEEIPARLPYLRPPEAQARAWSARLGKKTRARVGLAWSGSMDHSNDLQRSMPAVLLADLVRMDAEFHCLQKVIREADRDGVSRMPVKTWEQELHDFADTAALTAGMDLVISVDTSVAHLAGGMGIPVWVMLPYVPDMRWLLGREDSPWYPQVMRLLRQGRNRQWPEVMQRVRQELEQFLNQPASSGLDFVNAKTGVTPYGAML